MKKWSITLLVAFAIQAQAADDNVTYNYLMVTNADGNCTPLVAEGLKMTFTNGNLTATSADGTTTTLPLASLATMVFAENADGAATVIDSTADSDRQGTVEVYSLSGTCLGTFESMSQLKATLKAGIYVVKQNGTTKKISVK